MEILLNYLGRFVYLLAWALTLHCVAYVASAVVKEAHRTKRALNFAVSPGVVLGGAFLTAVLYMLIAGASALIEDPGTLLFSRLAAISIVLLSMFVNCNAELFKTISRK